jgi:hypothetical protein
VNTPREDGEESEQRRVGRGDLEGVLLAQICPVRASDGGQSMGSIRIPTADQPHGDLARARGGKDLLGARVLLKFVRREGVLSRGERQERIHIGILVGRQCQRSASLEAARRTYVEEA